MVGSDLKTVPYLNIPDVEECLISEKRFIDDMVRSELVVGTAGTQMIGELAYLGAPAILIPEAGQKEQMY